MAVEGHDTASVGLAIDKARWLAAITVGVMLFAFACATEPEPDDASQLMAATVTPSAELSDIPPASQQIETPPAAAAVLPTLTPQPTATPEPTVLLAHTPVPPPGPVQDLRVTDVTEDSITVQWGAAREQRYRPG